MRLIDANGSCTLNASDNTGYSLGFGGGIISVADEYGHIVAEFFADDAPTIETEPTKSGQWVDRYGGKYVNPLYECSECKETALYKAKVNELGNEYFAQELSAVCPHCGAKMDKEKTDG